MLYRHKITEIFCMAYDFCKLYDRFIKSNGLELEHDKLKCKYIPDLKMSSVENNL